MTRMTHEEKLRLNLSTIPLRNLIVGENHSFAQVRIGGCACGTLCSNFRGEVADDLILEKNILSSKGSRVTRGEGFAWLVLRNGTPCSPLSLSLGRSKLPTSSADFVRAPVVIETDGEKC